jgi:hypothetical protein
MVQVDSFGSSKLEQLRHRLPLLFRSGQNSGWKIASWSVCVGGRGVWSKGRWERALRPHLVTSEELEVKASDRWLLLSVAVTCPSNQ